MAVETNTPSGTLSTSEVSRLQETTKRMIRIDPLTAKCVRVPIMRARMVKKLSQLLIAERKWRKSLLLLSSWAQGGERDNSLDPSLLNRHLKILLGFDCNKPLPITGASQLPSKAFINLQCPDQLSWTNVYGYFTGWLVIWNGNHVQSFCQEIGKR